MVTESRVDLLMDLIMIGFNSSVKQLKHVGFLFILFFVFY